MLIVFCFRKGCFRLDWQAKSSASGVGTNALPTAWLHSGLVVVMPPAPERNPMRSVKIINVTRRVRDLIRQKADPTRFRETAVECADGTFDVPIGDDTWERLLEHALDGESVSETIERMVMFDTTNNRRH